MSIRALLAIVLLLLSLAWTLRRPFVGVCVNVLLFHLNLRALGAGLENIRFQFYATIVLFISYFINYEQLHAQPAITRPPMRWLYAFTAMTFITSMWAVASPAHAFDSAFEFSKIVLFVWLMTQIIKTEHELRILMYVIIAGCWYTSFMAQWGVEWDLIDEIEVGVATGGTGTHLMMFLPLMILLAIYGAWKERLFVIFVIPFVLNFLPNTEEGMRSTFLTLVVTVALLFLLAPGSMRWKALPPILVGGLLFVFVLTPPGYFEYMTTILDPSSENSAASRSVINQASFEILKDYPMGIGYDNYPMVSLKYLPEEALSNLGTRDAHNSFLKVATEFGIIGFLIWITTALLTWTHFRKIRKTLQNGVPPTMLQLCALSFEIALIGVAPGMWTHNYNQLDSLYWLVALSGIMYNLHLQTNTAAEAQAPVTVLQPQRAKAGGGRPTIPAPPPRLKPPPKLSPKAS
ncbi:MAG: O-antigen ligase family protein [candidate division KSB1 bacterium]|nr:O-antigen ligase family protein [candidate division KSB1 bacterium]MDZ7272769.1 O-antigen ligase family protein [candidate division KSB1 bacterium]MDZ7284207.1 O-antigen ligase family protein [candidate division KSB1 bacterium]MDZ7297395.1 O-antigen ligase family protein [candidate division KSB1 bacterium]MDZ7306545.1 O-antigen ligase family protein [candidate division KSB1 bacterium]